VIGKSLTLIMVRSTTRSYDMWWQLMNPGFVPCEKYGHESCHVVRDYSCKKKYLASTPCSKHGPRSQNTDDKHHGSLPKGHEHHLIYQSEKIKLAISMLSIKGEEIVTMASVDMRRLWLGSESRTVARRARHCNKW
jgi:hypothetical protein